MQSIRIRRFSLLSIFCGACFILPLSACNDEHTDLNDEPPIEDGENDQSQPHEEITLLPLSVDDPRPRIPCEGDLCYDPNDPVTKAAYNEFYDRLVGPEGTQEDRDFFRERFQIISDHYAACNYYENDGGYTVVECPEWATRFNMCPGYFFAYFKQGLPRALTIRDALDAKYYCLHDIENNGGTSYLCGEDYVLSGSLSTRWENAKGETSSPSCLKAETCLDIARLEGVSGHDVCFYGDFTAAVTGEIPAQNCDDLAPGTCAINCACDNENRPDELQLSCQYLSEENPVGLCGYATCSALQMELDCYEPNTACAVGQWPQWAKDAAAEGPMKSAKKGTCVQKDACDAWSQTHPNIVKCGTPLPDNPFE